MFQKAMKESVLVVESMMSDTNHFGKRLIDMKVREQMEAFAAKPSGRDPPRMPNQIPKKNKNQVIYEEICELITNYKVSEHKLF